MCAYQDAQMAPSCHSSGSQRCSCEGLLRLLQLQHRACPLLAWLVLPRWHCLQAKVYKAGTQASIGYIVALDGVWLRH